MPTHLYARQSILGYISPKPRCPALQNKIANNYLKEYQSFVNWIDTHFNEDLVGSEINPTGDVMADLHAFIYLLGPIPGVTYQHALSEYGNRAVQINTNKQFTATGYDSQGNVAPIQAKWSVSGGRNIDQTGLFSAGSTTGGPFTITAQDQGITATTTVHVTNLPSEGLIGYWSFDEGSGATAVDSSGNGNNGVLANGTAWVSGKVGGAIDFDGSNDYVDILDSNSLALSQISVILWMKADVVKNAYLQSKGASSTQEYELRTASDGKFLWVIGATPQGGNIAAGKFSVGTWTHVVGTYDGVTIRLYVNGIQVGTKTLSGTLKSSASPLRIGSTMFGTEIFDGQIDDVRIYNRVLTDAEIQTLFNPPQPDQSQTCVEQGGTICKDNEYCPGNDLPVTDTARCCSVACVIPTWPTCIECGTGLFNLCDRDECNSISENCYYLYNIITWSCNPCLGAICESYSTDQTTCTENHCNLQNCKWDGSKCITGPKLIITFPTQNQIIKDTIVDVTYTVSGDISEVNHVHLQLDNNPEVRDLDFDGKYQFINVPIGTHTIIAYLARADHIEVGDKISITFTVSSLCGNRIIDSTEECDDGNIDNGDGCSVQCTREPPDISVLKINV